VNKVPEHKDNTQGNASPGYRWRYVFHCEHKQTKNAGDPKANKIHPYDSSNLLHNNRVGQKDARGLPARMSALRQKRRFAPSLSRCNGYQGWKDIRLMTAAVNGKSRSWAFRYLMATHCLSAALGSEGHIAAVQGNDFVRRQLLGVGRPADEVSLRNIPPEGMSSDQSSAHFVHVDVEEAGSIGMKLFRIEKARDALVVVYLGCQSAGRFPCADQ
jgi:hypothetical protein